MSWGEPLDYILENGIKKKVPGYVELKKQISNAPVARSPCLIKTITHLNRFGH